MKSRTVFSVAMWMCLALAAQVHADRGLWTAPPVSPAAADVEWRIVVRFASAAACPDPSPRPWQAAALFPRASHSTLGRYCTYTYNGAGSVTAQHQDSLRRYFDSLGLTFAFAPDRLAMSPLADPLDPTMLDYLTARFLAETSVAQWPTPIAGGPLPRLALVDTAPTEVVAPHLRPDLANHGYVLANMARALLCPTDDDGSCLAAVTAQLALAYETFDPGDPSQNVRNENQGGYFGTLADLAAAIHAEVSDWLDGPGPGQRLVINLSVGWHSMFGDFASTAKSAVSIQPGPVPAQPLPAAQAVFDAIHEARCKGALIIAAAGNRGSGPNASDRGALFPAAWEGTAFDRDACEPDDRDAGDSGGPLVYAVGGVDAAGRRLANARPLSEPPRVAFADHARVPTVVWGAPGETLTGSSVASLVVASAAAAVWRYRPELGPEKVMAIVDAGGTTITVDGPRDAEVCLGCPLETRPVRRIGMCPTISTVCTSGDGDPICETLPACEPGPQKSLDFVSFDASAIALNFEDLVDDHVRTPGVTAVCGGVLYSPVGMNTREVLCPDGQLHSLRSMPWVGPQPASNMCPSCNSSNSSSSPSNGLPDKGRVPVEAPALRGIGATKVTLRIAVPTTVTQQLTAPTIATSEGIYRLREETWPCVDPGSTCVVSGVPHDNSGPVIVSYAIPDLHRSYCDASSAETCWSTTSYILPVP